MLHTIVLVTHVLIAALIVALVLLQRGKGADAGTGFGAGASGTVFGARGSATFFSRATGVLATVFFVTSLALAYLATQRTSADELVAEPGPRQPTSQPAPAAPSQPASAVAGGAPSAPASEADRRANEIDSHAHVVELVDTLS